MTPESRGSSSSTIKKGHVTQGWHGLYDWRLQYFNVFQHFPTLDIYRFTCRIWYQPSYSFVQNRLVSKRWIPEIQRFHHVPMNTQNSATILGQIAFQDHGVNQYVSHDFPYLPSFSHHFPIIFPCSHHFPMCVAMTLTSLPVLRLRARPWHHRCPVSSLLGWPGGMGVLELMLIMLPSGKLT